jgi:Tfp pilus assembly protein PilF
MDRAVFATNAGWVALRLGKRSRALRYFRQAISFNKDAASPQHGISIIRLQYGYNISVFLLYFLLLR